MSDTIIVVHKTMVFEGRLMGNFTAHLESLPWITSMAVNLEDSIYDLVKALKTHGLVGGDGMYLFLVEERSPEKDFVLTN